MSNKSIEITLLISNNTGVLSSLMIKAGVMGLTYVRQHTDRINDEQSRIVLYFNSEFNTSNKVPIKSFEEMPDVIKIEKVDIANSIF